MERRARDRHKELAAKAKQKRQEERRPLELPKPAHEYNEGGRKMYEYHVDAAENFLEWG
jgi:hypothetical protein